MVLNTWLRQSSSIPMIKAVAVGLADQRAVESAELAALGVTAPEDALETAFHRLDPAAEPQADATPIDCLGDDWTSHRNILKSYPAQIYTQAAIEATLTLRSRLGSPDDVRRIVLYGHSNVCGGVQGSPAAFQPATREAADHSTPYVMAMALLRGRLTPHEYEDDPWVKPDVLSTMARIELVVEPERDRAMSRERLMGVRLVATLSDGGTETVDVSQPRGHPDAPMSDDELVYKMTWLMDGVAGPDVAKTLLDACMDLDSPDDLRDLVRLCVTK